MNFVFFAFFARVFFVAGTASLIVLRFTYKNECSIHGEHHNFVIWRRQWHANVYVCVNDFY